MASPAGTVFSIEVADSRVAVVADCNRCNGPTVVGRSTITVGPNLACTRAYCATAPFDDTFVRLLAGESTATSDRQTLVLRSDRGVLRFRR
jgi:heat shock protein HslJ